MANKITNTDYYAAIAAAIRAKNGLTDTYTPAQMAAAIRAIPTGGGGTDERLALIYEDEGGDVIDLSDLNITTVRNLSGLKAGTQIILPDTVTEIASYAFLASKIANIDIPEGVTSIKSLAFNQCSEITTITLPRGLTTLESSAFSSCSKLTSIDIPALVAAVGGNAFAYCTAMTQAKIRAAALGSGQYSSASFSGCSNLKYVWISSNCATIWVSSATYAPFYNCRALTDIYCEAASKPSGWGTYWNYRSTNVQCTVHWGVTEEQFDEIVAAA